MVLERGVVACGHIQEAEAAAWMLEEGGNAVDAVVAAAFTGQVVEPVSCGLGGYGHMALFVAETGQPVSVDHSVRAPTAARPDMFEVDPSRPTSYYGWPRTVDRQNEWGAISAAVPGRFPVCAPPTNGGGGCLSGRCSSLRSRRPTPAFPSPGMSSSPSSGGCRKSSRQRLAAAHLLLRDGWPPTIPEDGGLPDGTDERIDTSRPRRDPARDRPRSRRLLPAAGRRVDRTRGRQAAASTADDLAAYQPKIAVEAGAWYRGIRYSTASDPVGYEALNILACFDLAAYGPESSEYRHLMAEAMGHAFVDNMRHYGDPDIVPSPVAGLASP